MELRISALVDESSDGALDMLCARHVPVLGVFGVPAFVVVYQVVGTSMAARSAVRGVRGRGC